jgi:hypothetical protein
MIQEGVGDMIQMHFQRGQTVLDLPPSFLQEVRLLSRGKGVQEKNGYIRRECWIFVSGEDPSEEVLEDGFSFR